MKSSSRESSEEMRLRARRIVTALRKRYPRATTALDYAAPHELLISTVLAAQCTDKKVNEITESLFKKYRSPEDFARAKRPTLEKEIRQSGFFRAKARSIVELSRDIVEKFGGRVPGTLEELTSLRGVGRKTANVVLAAVFGKPAVVVDTHMIRVAARLGLTTQTDPVKIEFELMDVLAKKDWSDFSFMIVLHGRQTCKARRPLCSICPIERMCPSSTLRRGV